MQKSSILRPLLGCLIAFLLFAPASTAQRKRLVAVLDFDFNTVDVGLARQAFGGVPNLAKVVAVKLGSRLTNLGTCQVIERTQLEKILREQNFGADGRLDPNTMAKMGKVLGVDSFVLGNVTVFDIKGEPEKGQKQSEWDSKNLSARLEVSFRVVDTTTALVEMSQEAIGQSPITEEKKPVKKGSEMANKIIGGLFSNKNTNGKPDPLAAPTDEQVKGVVEFAVDEVVGKISTALENHFSNARKRAEEPATPLAKQIKGRVLHFNGPTVYIADVDKSLVRRGDRLYVRRGMSKIDPSTKKEFKFTEKIGEVEIVEIQDELVVGSYSGSQAVKVGDIVTNVESGAGTSSMISKETPAPTPMPSEEPATAGPETPHPAATKAGSSSKSKSSPRPKTRPQQP
jgi:curli biogenesis system outer membrane secretion channel CsgG